VFVNYVLVCVCVCVCVIQLSYMEAVSARLIDPDTGTYLDQTTGEVMSLSLAISRGFVKPAEDDSQPPQFAMSRVSAGSRDSIGDETNEKRTRTVETKTIVDISSMPRRALSSEGVAMTGTSPAAGLTNGVESANGVEELDSLIAKMRDSASWTLPDVERSGSAVQAQAAAGVAQWVPSSSRVHSENGGALSSVRKTEIHHMMTMEEATTAGLVDNITGLVKDSSSGQMLTLEAAVKAGIIDGDINNVVDQSSGRRIGQVELVVFSGKNGSNIGVVDAVDSRVVTKEKRVDKALTLDEAMDAGLIDTETGLVTRRSSGRQMTVNEAISARIIDGEVAAVYPTMGAGLKSGVIGGTGVSQLETARTPAERDAMEIKRRQKQMTAEEAGKFSFLNTTTEMVTESNSGQEMMQQQSHISGLPATAGPCRSSDPLTEGMAHGADGTTSTIQRSVTESESSAAQSATTDVQQVSCRFVSQLSYVCSVAVHAMTVALIDDLMLSVLQSGEQRTTDTQRHTQATKLENDDDDMEPPLLIVEPTDLLKDEHQLDTDKPKLAAASSMTLLEAVSSGLADSLLGQFEDPHSGKKVPLRKAVELNMIATSKMVVTDTAQGETVSLAESVRRKIVDADYRTFVDTKANCQLTFTEAISEGFIRDDDRIPTLSELAANGQYDPSTGTVVDANTGQRVSLLEAIESKLLDRHSVRLLDPATGTEITLAEAFERGLLDPDTGTLVDTYAGQTVNLVDSVNKAVLGLTTTCSSVAKPPARHEGPSVADKHISLDGSNIREQKQSPDHCLTVTDVQENLKTYSIIDAIRDGIYNPKTNTVTDPVSGQQMSLEEAVDFGLIDASRAMVRDPLTGQKVAFEVLVQMSLIDISTGTVRDSQGRDIALEDAVLSGLMFENPPLSGPLTLLQLIDEGLFKAETSEFFDRASGELVCLCEAVDRSLLDPQSIVVHEIGSSEVLGIQDAVSAGVVDAESGHVRDNYSRELISLAEALDRDIVLSKPLPIVKAVDIGLLNETTAKFLDPSCRKFFSLASATDTGLIDADSCFTDPATGRAISVARAVSCGVLDPQSGCVTNVHTGDMMTLKESITAAKLMPFSAGKLMSLDEAISLGAFDQSSNVFIDPHTKEELTLEAAVAAGLLDSNSTMTDLATGTQVTVAELVNKTRLKVLIDDDEDKESVKMKRVVAGGSMPNTDGKAADPVTGQKLAYADAAEVDVAAHDAAVCQMEEVVGSEKRTGSASMNRHGDDNRTKLNMALLEVLQKGLFIEDTGTVEHPYSHELLTVQEAFDSGLIDEDSVKFKHPTAGLLMSFEQSVSSKLVDPCTGDVQISEGDSLTLKEAVGEGLVLTALTDQGLSLIDVVQQGVYHPVAGRLTHPFSGVEMTVQDGIETGLIDTQKTRVCVPNHEDMSTDEAISQKLINTVTGRFQEPDSGECLTLGEAITRNYLMEVKLSKFSVDEAVDCRIFDVETGILVDPVSNRRLNIAEAVKCGLLDASQTLLMSPDGSKMLSLDEAISVGMVDTNTGELVYSKTGQRMTFVEATDKGLVLDAYVPPMMSFTEASRKGLFDGRTGNFSHPVTGIRVNFEAAINTGLIDAEKCKLIVPGSDERISLATAIDENLIMDKFVKVTDPARRHTALLVDALTDEQNGADAEEHQRHVVTTKRMQKLQPTQDAESCAVSSEIESGKHKMVDVITSGGGGLVAVDISTDSTWTTRSVSDVSCDVLLRAVTD